jgi:hypothetical protein
MAGADFFTLRYKLEEYAEGYRGRLPFHGIISEAANIQVELTKFPVQSGFEVSNHIIKKNRQIKIEAIMSNLILPNQYSYGESANRTTEISPTGQITIVEGRTTHSNQNKTVFEALRAIIRSGTLCKIQTNLGVYEPVVLKSFKTTQGVGTMDSMKFIIDAEELILADSLNVGGPKELEFTLVPQEEYQALADRLFCNGIEIEPGASLATASANTGDSFNISGQNMISGAPDWMGMSTLTTEATALGGMIPKNSIGGIVDLGNGAPSPISMLGSCTGDVGIGEISSGLSDVVDTELGVLEEGFEGAKTDIVNMGGPALAPFIGGALDCVVAFAADIIVGRELDACGNEIAPTGLPSAGELLGGIAKTGVAVTQDFVQIGGDVIGGITTSATESLN